MKKAFTIALLMIAAVPFLIAVAALPLHGAGDTPVHTHVSARYLEQGAEEAGASNLVTGVLLNYRSLDTAGEVTVIFTAFAAVLAVLITAGTVSVSDGTDPRPPDSRPATRPVSPVVLFVVRLLAPFIAMFALYTILHGHVAPGGGFQGGAILGALFIALTVVLGDARMRGLMRPPVMVWLQGSAVLSFVVVGAVGAALTGHFLGYPKGPETHLAAEMMMLLLEFGIGIGGAVIFATIFLQMEAD